MKRFLKILLLATSVLLLLLLMAGTVFERFSGAETAASVLYSTPWFAGLWGVLVVSGCVYLWRCGVHRRLPVLLIHLAFIVILIGALTTHLWGVQGTLHLRKDLPTRLFVDREGRMRQMPFDLTLTHFTVHYYEGTRAPMNYESRVRIGEEQPVEGSISMNRILTHRHYRFYQTGYDEDGQGTILSVAYDPWGIGITYVGYALLFVSLLIFLLHPQMGFRRLLAHPALRRPLVLVLPLCCLLLSACRSSDEVPQPKVLPAEVAADFGRVSVLYHERICPLQTVAYDFTMKLYGSTDYRGYTPEQVLTGWLFYFDSWKRQPMVKVKGQVVKDLLGIHSAYASLVDYADARNRYKLEEPLRRIRSGDEVPGARAIEEADEKFNLVSMLYMGTLLKLFPVRHADGSTVDWYAPADRLPEGMSDAQSLFVHRFMSLLAEQLLQNNTTAGRQLIEKLRAYQAKESGLRPTAFRSRAELLYNQTRFTRPFAMIFLTVGIVSFIFYVVAMACGRRVNRWAVRLFGGLLVLLFVYLTYIILLRAMVSGHLPLANGFETMQFMAWCVPLLSFFFHRRLSMAVPFGLLMSGLALLVAMLGEASPPVTPLMPVLASPLLSIHVVIIMLAYTLLAFVMLNGITALLLHAGRRTSVEAEERLMLFSQAMLYPAVFLLAAGIFIGAIWANQSWGRYWGWDPKEVWALITLLIYSFALHRDSIPRFRRPLFFHVFAVLAFLSVIITYFGVNYLLGGLHSYGA